MLISDEYRALNERLHSDRPDYGTSGKRYAEAVTALVNALDTKDVLDYGCGKRTLETALGYPIANYDPCVPGFDVSPEPHDLVVCTDVMEHVEPENLADVLADIRRVTKRAAYLTIATRPAAKTLADGRNAHLIQQGPQWWVCKLWDAGFRLRQYFDLDFELQVVVE